MGKSWNNFKTSTIEEVLLHTAKIHKGQRSLASESVRRASREEGRVSEYHERLMKALLESTKTEEDKKLDYLTELLNYGELEKYNEFATEWGAATIKIPEGFKITPVDLDSTEEQDDEFIKKLLTLAEYNKN